ncbi:hypothetical protein KP509_24G042200 [Ceratopteris richardii]|uniref:Uncharacterized protein n=1 Tax=Ceratopteris richardii TaxID=49495 RepID=A0A8T2RWE9_CERRI|nr:hypothetical protein KP509_24G042200 [Ceratopteris richardii]
MGASSEPLSSSDSDGEESERLLSVAVDSSSVLDTAALLVQKKHKYKKIACSNDEGATTNVKFYQMRAHDILHEYVDKTYEIVPAVKGGRDEAFETEENIGFHLFKYAPSGLTEKTCQQGASVSARKRFLGNDIEESSEMFKSQVMASAVDGEAVKLAAEKSKAKAFALWMLHQAEEKESKEKEKHRVALLKSQRGEKWLPSVIRDMARDNDLDSNPSLDITRTPANVGHKAHNVCPNGDCMNQTKNSLKMFQKKNM